MKSCIRFGGVSWMKFLQSCYFQKFSFLVIAMWPHPTPLTLYVLNILSNSSALTHVFTTTVRVKILQAHLRAYGKNHGKYSNAFMTVRTNESIPSPLSFELSYIIPFSQKLEYLRYARGSSLVYCPSG